MQELKQLYISTFNKQPKTVEQLKGEKPTHIFLQAGVGAMSGGITGFFADLYGDEDRPIITIVEPNKAACIYRTAEANDGKLHFVTGDMQSIMAGLCCGEPCAMAWDILNGRAQHFFDIVIHYAPPPLQLSAF